MLLSKEELAEIKARADKATPGEWVANLKKCRTEGECPFGERQGLCSRCLPVGVWGNSEPIGETAFVMRSGVCFPGTQAEPIPKRFADDADFIAHARTDIPALLAHIEELEGEAWQPIETAPKDGTPILLAWHWKTDIPGHEGVAVVLARWVCRKHSYPPGYHDCPNEPDCQMGWDSYGGEMTHWRPLPKVPEAVCVVTTEPKV